MGLGIATVWRDGGRDSTAVRLVVGLRLAAVLAIAGIGSFVVQPHGDAADLLLVIGLVGVPWATIVFFCADRRDNRIAVYGGPIGDALMLFVVQLMLPGATEAVLPGYLVLVAFSVYTVGRSFAMLIIGASVAFTFIAYRAAPDEAQLHTSVMVPFLVAAIAVVLLIERTTALQERATTTSARLQSRADTILAHVADAVLVTDEGGTVTQCNAAAERLLARSNAQLQGAACADVLRLHIGERPVDCSGGCALLAAQAAGELGDRELWRPADSGQRQPLLAEAAEVVAPDGRSEVVHSVHDITRLKQAEEAKTLFLATASHELKTPLTVIAGFASTLIRYPNLSDEQRAGALDAIWTRSLDLTRIVERLLMSSRIEAGHLDIDLETLDVAPLVSDRVDSIAAGMTRRITFRTDAELPPVVANSGALTTVIDHLVDNAIKYSPDGQSVEVRLHALEHVVVLDITDHGIGMDAEQARHCFDRFWQAESTDVRRFGGTGIGLYIVRSLVEAMRANISVQSTVGEGSTFSVLLMRTDVIPVQAPPGIGESTSIDEFMRQIGVPDRVRR